MRISIKFLISVLLVTLCLGMLIVGCSDDEEELPVVKEGVVFTLTRKLVYSTGVNEIGSVKITLSDGKEKIILPSLPLKGNEEQIKSEPCPLAAGSYRITAYTAYNTRHEFLFDAELDSKNEFKVNSNEIVEFKIPIKTREIMSANFLRNALMGICREVFGEDESIWPWNPKKYPYPDWEGLEFELDDYGSPMYLSGITFEGMKDGKETPWAQMTALPDGTLSNIAELASINIVDIPAFKKLPEDLDRLPNLQQISCINTGVEELPENVKDLKTLSGLILIDCCVEHFSYDLSKLEELRLLSLSGNKIETFDTPLGGLKKLVSLDLSNNPLREISESCFSGTTKLNGVMLRNTELSTLPASLAKEKSLRRLDLSGSKFCSVPAVVNELSGLKTLILDRNNLVTFKSEEIQQLLVLENLSLAGNKIGSFPVLTNPNLAWLDLTSCDLTVTPNLESYDNLCVLLMGDNAFSTLPESYFASNKHMKILNLSHSPKLTSLPNNLGLNAILDTGREGFRLMEITDCPSLHWTTPVQWNCYDFNHDNDWIFSEEDNVSIANEENFFEDEYWGRVGVRRTNSPFVILGN